MANIYKDMNVRQKLAKARLYFLNQKIKKSGKNMHLEFKYFELEDIVPAAIRIFANVGLTTSTVFDGENATMTVLNVDNMEEPGIVFTLPYRENKPIVSNQGKEVTNPMQALGASTTYLRRYLWMMVLDVTEPDEVDANLGNDQDGEEPQAAPPEKDDKGKKRERKRPPTQAERKATTEELTDTDGNADELQITALKNACKELMEKDEKQEDFIQEIALKTQGFTVITRSACEQLIKNLGEMIAAYGESG